MASEMLTGAFVSTFVERTIDSLASRFAKILRARKHDKNQLSDLKMKLLAIDVVADDAEQKQFTDPRVRDWLLRAKDVVVDAEDILDEIDYEVPESQVEAESQSAGTKVWWNSVKSSFVGFFENEISSRIEKVIENLKDLEKESHYLSLQKGSGLGVGSGSGSKLTYTSLPNENVIYGRDDDKQFIFNWLTSDTDINLSILSIVGMGGLGKTSLAQHVFNDPRIEGKFNIKAWVSVPQEFDVLNVSKAILEGVSTSPVDSTNLEGVHKKLKEELMGKKFLLVLDDNWNENNSKWEQVQKALEFGAPGSRLLVTTRSEKVVVTMRSEKHLLQVLRKDYCWDLFAKHAFQSANSQLDPDFIEIGRKIVEKCNGLPLALKTMGSLLYNKPSLREWESIMKSEMWDFSENESNVLPALKLSYLHLPSHLKKCFASCALFPKGCVLNKESLIQLWMAENFLESSSTIKSPKEVGEQYFNDLLSWSFFQQSNNEEENAFIMHDLLMDLAKYLCQDICIRLGVDEPQGIHKRTRHFSFATDLIRIFDGFGNLIDSRKLHTFVQTGWRRYPPMSFWRCNTSVDDLFSIFKYIRVLSLNGFLRFTEVPKSIGNLKHIRSLDLSYTEIEKLPNSIGLLYKLQTLKLNYCERLKELPSGLLQLDRLCFLELLNTKVKNVHILGKLKNLQVLMNSFCVDMHKELSIQQLGQINLHGSLSISGLQNIEDPSHASEAYLKNKPHLLELEFKWNWSDSSSVDSSDSSSDDSTKDDDVIENLQPSKYLKKLSISSYMGEQFPNWLFDNSLPNLMSLMLEECEYCDRLPPLGLLPSLKDLRIEKLHGIVSIDTDFYGNNSSSFQSLETLYFFDMEKLEKWECKVVTGAFPRLQKLSIKGCPKLKGQLPELLVPLEKLIITDCEKLEAVAPRALDIKLEESAKVLFDWATVKSLQLAGYIMEASFLDMVRKNIPDNSIQHLEINGSSFGPPPNIGDSVSLWTFPLHFFPTLKNLALLFLNNLQMISQNHAHNHLESLHIGYCPKLESLPENRDMLKSLYISDCPRLEPFTEGGLPSNLREMTLSNCSRLVGSLKGAFGDNPSLKTLHIENLDAECFPDEGLLPRSLTELAIRNFLNLQKLDYRVLNQLSYLKSLILSNCPKLQRLPEEGLPKSISDLSINLCFSLENRCREGGEDWEKVAHIPRLRTPWSL